MQYLSLESILPPGTNRKAILLADLKSAKFAGKLIENQTSNDFIDHFIQYHHHLTQSITGVTVTKLEQVKRDKLKQVIHKWACIYLEGIQKLRQQFPIHSDQHLLIDNKDWSIDLEIGARGLLKISGPSRYAEYWVEKSLDDENIFHSYEKRFSFLSTDEHAQISKLKSSGSLLVLDQSQLGVTSYDIFNAVITSPHTNFILSFKSHAWETVDLDEHVQSYFEHLRKKYQPNILTTVLTMLNQRIFKVAA